MRQETQGVRGDQFCGYSDVGRTVVSSEFFELCALNELA
jgi:hypothetical protein